MPVKTVTIKVEALTDKANAEIRATGKYFDDLRAKNPVELKVKLDSAQALAESKILAREMSRTVRDTVKLETDRAGAGGLGGLIGRLIPGGSIPLPGPLGAIPATPVGLAGGAAGGVAALAALPFLAQAAASAVTFGLGSSLVGIGVAAEKGVRSVQYQFAQLWSGQNGIQATFKNISPAFGQALTTILSAARTFVPQFVRDFGPALNAIAGPLKSFGVEIAGSLAKPEVAASLKALGEAFGGILKALTPAIPGIVTAIADGFTNLFRAVGKNPKAIADVAIGLGHLIGVLLDTIAWLTNVAAYIEQHAIPAWHDLQRDILNWTLNVGRWVGDLVHLLEHDLDNLTHWWATGWDLLWRNTVTRAQHGVNDVVSWVAGLKTRALNALSGLGQSLWNFMSNAMGMFLHGAEHVLGSIENFFTSLPKKILGWLGIHSPPDWALKAGEEIVNGITGGMTKAQQRAAAATRALAAAAAGATGGITGSSAPYGGGYGVGVQQWAPDVVKALRMEGLSSGLLGNVLYQMMTESGGNPNAINLWDINAKQGDPSRGLMQVIMTTFDAYHWPGTSYDIYDPLANIAAALNYAKHRYGPTLMSGGFGIGSGHGYDQGGWLMPGVTMAVNTSGRPERVTSGPAEDALLGELAAIVDRLETLIGVTAGVGADVASGLNGAARSAGYSALYGTRP